MSALNITCFEKKHDIRPVTNLKFSFHTEFEILREKDKTDISQLQNCRKMSIRERVNTYFRLLKLFLNIGKRKKLKEEYLKSWLIF